MSNQVRMQHDVDIAVIGAGVSGLATAYLLRQAGRSVRVLEAADEPGGRIRSFHSGENKSVVVGDRGPTWVWPEYQPTIGHWLAALDVEPFEQFEVGKSIVEMDPEAPPTATILPAQHGSMRIAGGTAKLIERLMWKLGEDIVETRAKVRRIERTDCGVSLQWQNSSMRATQVIVAVPPRGAVGTINWAPALPEVLERALKNLPTWMAAHAKAVIVYEKPFWRENGLSGRIASRVGPLMEVHD
ncbi:MAG: FAD-dependent oxidoreductase, partial [Pseudomonadota bacterium]